MTPPQTWPSAVPGDHTPVYAPWGVVSPDFWHVESPPPPPSPPIPAPSVAPSAPSAAPVPAAPVPAAPASAAPSPAAPAPVRAHEPSAAERPSPPEERPVPPPEAYRARVAAATSAFATAFAARDQAGMRQASVEVERLDGEITAEYGQRHLHTANVRELRGWLAYLMGHHAVAARWYLHTAGLLATTVGAQHHLTQSSAARILPPWLAIADPAESRAVGTEILPVLVAVTGADSKATRTVRKRLEHLPN